MTTLTLRSIDGWKNWVTSAHVREIYADEYYTEVTVEATVELLNTADLLTSS